MRALDPEVVDAVWEQLKDLLPQRPDEHPLGCHRQRIDDRICFRGIVIRLATGCSWEDAERLIDHAASDTTLRSRRTEWLAAGVFDDLFHQAIDAYDRAGRLNLEHASVDGSLHKAPCGGPGSGKNPTDRAKLGWKWSIACDFSGIPIGWAIDGANRQDSVMIRPTLEAIPTALLRRIGTLHLDRGYDNKNVRAVLTDLAVMNPNIARRRRGKDQPEIPAEPLRKGKRWPVERTNSWLSNYGQMRRNTDRRSEHRHAQLALVVTILITAKLLDHAKATPIH